MAMVGKQSIQRPKPANDIPSVLAGYIGGSLDDVEWRALGGGIKQKIIMTGHDATARLLYIPAGQSAPDHGHSGMELTLVLRGAFKDESGHYRAGDIEITDDPSNTPPSQIWGRLHLFGGDRSPNPLYQHLLPRFAAVL